MNAVHEETLKRRLFNPASTPSQLLAKAQAARELANAAVPLPLERVKVELEALLETAQALASWQADRAANVAGRVHSARRG